MTIIPNQLSRTVVKLGRRPNKQRETREPLKTKCGGKYNVDVPSKADTRRREQNGRDDIGMETAMIKTSRKNREKTDRYGER